MGVFLTSVSGVMQIVLLILLGYFLTIKGWFDDRSSKIIAKCVTQIALPAYMIVTISSQFKAEELLRMLPDLFFPVLSMMILYLISFPIVKLIHVPENHKGTFQSMFFNSNTVFIGLPVDMALFGAKSIPYLLVYYMANTTIFWTLGTFLIQKDGPHSPHFDLKKSLGKLFSPPLLGFMTGILLVILHIKLPDFLAKDFGYVGNLTVPGSMIFIGIAIAQVGLKKLEMNREIFTIFLGRFVLAPIIMTLLIFKMPLPSLMKQVFILQSAMPVMTTAPVVAKLYGADSKFAAITVAETTLFSMIVIPIIATLIQL